MSKPRSPLIVAGRMALAAALAVAAIAAPLESADAKWKKKRVYYYSEPEVIVVPARPRIVRPVVVAPPPMMYAPPMAYVPNYPAYSDPGPASLNLGVTLPLR